MNPLPCLVLDTNIVLDCFVFADPATRELTAAIQARRVQVLVHEQTLEELERVLAYPQCRLSATEQVEIRDHYRSLATHAPVPEGFDRDNLFLPAAFPHCRDGDDDLFLALAYHARADALVTRDKAVLKLRRKTGKFGVTIVPPGALSELKQDI